ncbi:unnamed protein product [Symbiodinium pilosum]|uniref:Uncharacterized protein n=1 Tax=Symbiodinium pilosum TaxID=2952 RepID=A0A812QLZ4_SYMPI|nr:unnamed protein product [Symbiodinium pilosum]
MFVPPPPKVVPPVPVVAPYVSDADQRKMIWKLGMQQHLRALEGVTKVTDQSDPSVADAGVRKAREKARDFIKHEMRRDIESENRHLVHRLKEIVEKPSVISKVSEGANRHLGTRREMLQRDRQIRQKHIQAENQSLVRRLLSVKSSLNLQGLEKDYRRHRQDVGRLQQLPEKGSRPRRLPKLPEKVVPELPQESYSPKSSCSGYRPRPSRQALPLPPRMTESRSMPSLPSEATAGNVQQKIRAVPMKEVPEEAPAAEEGKAQVSPLQAQPAWVEPTPVEEPPASLEVPAAEVHEKGEAKQQTEEDTDASGNPAGATG